MNENRIPEDTVQVMLNYYRNKCSQLEYEFLLYKATAEKQIAEIQSIADGRRNAESPTESSN
jgi:hypothetical protein